MYTRKPLPGVFVQTDMTVSDPSPTTGTLLRDAVRRLRESGVEAPERNAEWLLSEVLSCGRAHLLAYPEAAVDPERARAFEAMIAQRLRRRPLQYILGYADFHGLRLKVTPDVLIPRPETEEVVEAALATLAGVTAPRVLDVGTGSGCIALAVRHARPDAGVYACDVSEAALAVARENARRLALTVSFVQADALAERFADRVPGRLDLLLSNPPYVPFAEAETLAPEVREHEPHQALFVEADPLRFYRALADVAPGVLRAGGWLVVETHADYGEAVRDHFAACGLREVELRRDLGGHPRIVLARKE